MNYQRLYNDHEYYNSESASASEAEEDFDAEEMEKNNLKYDNKHFYLTINTEDRDWVDLYKDTFIFQVRFNASGSSNETRNIFTNFDNNIDNINRFNRTITTERYNGSRTLGIPINIKNINSITINRVLLPTRNIYIGNGNFVNLIELRNINIVIDEFSNINYGTNNISNFIFSSLIQFTPIYPETSATKIPNFIEFKNVRMTDKEFKPAPLNSINSLTFNFYDSSGNRLKYLNNILTISSIDYDNTDNKFIKIVTNEYFYRNNYREDDIIIIKNISNSSISNFLERKEGHKIYYSSSYSEGVNLSSITTLQNEFYIIKNGDFNSSGVYTINESITGIINNSGGSILNKNLQITLYMTINSRHKSLDIFNSHIV